MPRHLTRFAVMVASLLVAATASVVAQAAFQAVDRHEDDGMVPVVRYAGANRFETAALVATDGSALAPAFAPGSVVIARGDTFPDALAGSFLAGQLRAPILLTAVDALPQMTVDALFTLNPRHAYVLGGESAVSAAVEAELRGTFGLQVTRVAGSGRNETAAAIAMFGPVRTEGLEFVREQGTTGDGAGAFEGPTDVTSGPDGTIYVADQFNDRVQVFTPSGQFLRFLGADGTGPGDFGGPVGVATANDGTVFVSEFSNARVQAFTPAGGYLQTLATRGEGADQFTGSATGLSVGPDGDVYVGDDTGRILVIGPDGTFRRALGSPGSGPGQLAAPRGMDHDADGNLWVADRDNNRLVQLSPTGQQLAEITMGTDERPLSQPYDVTIGTDGRLYVADRGNGRIQVLLPDGTPVAGVAVAGGSAPDMDPIALGLGPAGEIIVGDFALNRLVVFAVAGSEFGLLDGVRTAFVATGERASDALVAGAVSARRGLPLLLASSTSLPPATADALRALDIEQVVIVGGPAAVGDGVASELNAMDIGVLRVHGANRVETSIAFARFAMDRLDFRLDHVNLASGGSAAFPDTLALGPHAGLERSAILLTGGGPDLDPPLRTFFEESGVCTVQSLHVAGGTAPLPDAIVSGLRAVVPYDPGCNVVTAPTPEPVVPGGGSELPTEPPGDHGGLSVTAERFGAVGEERVVTVSRAGASDDVQVEVYAVTGEPAEPSRRLVAEARTTLNGGTGTVAYTASQPDSHLVVACVVVAPERCTTGEDNPFDPRAIRIRTDLPAVATAELEWTAELMAPLFGPPMGTDHDGSGVLHATVTAADTLCYGFASVAGIGLPAGQASIADAASPAAPVLTLPPPGADGTAVGCVTADPELLASLTRFNDEIEYVVRVGGGAIAGQIFHSQRLPTLVTGAADLHGGAISGGAPAGEGFAVVSVVSQHQFVCSEILVAGVTLPAASAAIHRGGPDGTGPAILELPPPGALDGTYGCVAGWALTGNGTPTDLVDLQNRPEDFSVVVTTPEGRLSGPLSR